MYINVVRSYKSSSKEKITLFPPFIPTKQANIHIKTSKMTVLIKRDHSEEKQYFSFYYVMLLEGDKVLTEDTEWSNI